MHASGYTFSLSYFHFIIHDITIINIKMEYNAFYLLENCNPSKINVH